VEGSIAEEKWRYFGFPGRHVKIAKGFRLGRHEVTYGQFDFYVWTEHRAGHGDRKFPTTAKGGRGNRPVVNVTLREASDYASWLGKRTRQDCRLPTEAEWEYAARGQKNPALPETAYPWGNEVGTNRANCRGCGSLWDGEQSAPVGSFGANGFGLHDTSGNVEEITCSAWREKLDNSAEQCADVDGPDDPGVVRGGAWNQTSSGVRSAVRLEDFGPGGHGSTVGFRVLCAIE
jgi:formylglycine-generating enzyme required for sulfatase activity